MRNLILKIKMKHILFPLMAWLIPIKPLIILVGFCIFVDTAFGIWKSYKLNVPITSRRLSNIISKMVLYQSALILFYAIEIFILGDFILLFTSIKLFLTKIISIILVGVEITSISESLKAVTGKSLWQRLKELLRRANNAKKELNEFEELKKF